jgi:integrase
MKMRVPHLVPLAKQAVAILEELHPLTGAGRYVFPCNRTKGRCMSNMTINAALRRLGYEQGEMCAHGFRAMASTMLNELGWPHDVIERQLAHAERNKVRATYNRATHLPERRKMMQAWADYLDRLKTGARVTPIHATAGE